MNSKNTEILERATDKLLYEYLDHLVLVEPLSESLQCFHCNKIIKRPVQVTCGHRWVIITIKEPENCHSCTNFGLAYTLWWEIIKDTRSSDRKLRYWTHFLKYLLKMSQKKDYLWSKKCYSFNEFGGLSDVPRCLNWKSCLSTFQYSTTPLVMNFVFLFKIEVWYYSNNV